jgi:soluble lytic murein transglycosylase-like protein
MIPAPACIAEASDTYHVHITAIESIVAHGLPAGVVRNGRAGPMGIPVQWLPIFDLMGIDHGNVVSDPCENIFAGTWIIAYMAAIQSARPSSAGRGAYAPRSYAPSAALVKRRREWAPVVQEAASETGVPAALIDAVITVESGYQVHAVSKSKPPAIGMMQLLRSTAGMFGGDPWNGAQNIRMGARYLAQLARQFDGDLNLTLAAYNAGPAAVTRSGYRIPPFAETQAYVPNVLAIYASAEQ